MLIKGKMKFSITCWVAALFVGTALPPCYFWVHSVRTTQLLAEYAEDNNTRGMIAMLNNGADPNASTDWIIEERARPLDPDYGKPPRSTGLASIVQDVQRALHPETPRFPAQHRTALMGAILHNNAEGVDVLLRHGANANACTTDGSTPLLAAATHCDPIIVSMLIKHGAVVNASNNDGITPLIVAIGGNQPANVKLLIEYGANLNATTKGGITPIQLARKGKNPRIISLLEAALKSR